MIFFFVILQARYALQTYYIIEAGFRFCSFNLLTFGYQGMDVIPHHAQEDGHGHLASQDHHAAHDLHGEDQNPPDEGRHHLEEGRFPLGAGSHLQKEKVHSAELFHLEDPSDSLSVKLRKKQSECTTQVLDG